MQSKAQQQKNRRQAVKAKKDAILAIDKIMADNAKNISPPRNLVNNDANYEQLKFRKQMVSINTSTCNKSKLCRKETTE